ncbi:hypothetical protein Tco_0409571 [Tanacetum coccineum]
MAKLIKQRSHEVQELKNPESSYLFKKKQDLKFEVKVKLVTNKHKKSMEDYKELRAEDINMECYNSTFRIKNDLNLGEIIWKYCKDVHIDNTYWWHDYGFEEEERDEMGIEIEKYDPPYVQVETFEVKKY